MMDREVNSSDRNVVPVTICNNVRVFRDDNIQMFRNDELTMN